MDNFAINSIEQNHLNLIDTTNLGSYYTSSRLVEIAYNLLANNIDDFNGYTILDSSCGYGSFLRPSPKCRFGAARYVGSDIDAKAVRIARCDNPHAVFFNHNALKNVSRAQYNLSQQQHLIVVGNPPYNDTTSIIKNHIKKNATPEIDSDLRARDLGISFMLSYSKLNADVVCVLHPLSYLIKKSNFALMGNFKRRYKLIDALVVSSQEFSNTSRTTAFPILIALYKRDNWGMSYKFIENYPFKTIEGRTFRISAFDFIGNYIAKYPNGNFVKKEEVVALFWTMRDINALKRSRTFINEANYNTVYVTKKNLDYYCFVDVFKSYIKNIPYYLGNCDVIINIDEFNPLKKIFRNASLIKYDHLKFLVEKKTSSSDSKLILEKYFTNLLGEHFVSQ